ncbi:sensor histidine kinase [Pedobacter sandarakinus]|uniref:sensor histidine kinase n=1 Tax=Pedobacter sandarakinus TaxID=353156 RepID=UPI002246B575|nr:histidine kinase [Pedobacter sandarakinus]MCX2574889.1 histidine kinase [Pedobacter sandarakinus]
MGEHISSWFKRNWIHVLVWSIFIAYEIGVVGLVLGTFSNPINYASHYIIIISFFYFNAHKLLPWALTKEINTFWLLPLSLAISISIYILANYELDILLTKNHLVETATPIVLDTNYILKILYRSVYILGFSVAYFFLINYLRERQLTERMHNEHLERLIEEEKMKRSLAKAQNDFLKAQINPHFLFNTLDYIFHTISEVSHDGADAVMTLSEMMRYAVDSTDVDDAVLLGDELEQVNKLIYIYQLRKNMELKIMTYFSDEVMALRIIPLVVLTLVENIFKHGNVNHPDLPILISVVLAEKKLCIETRNAINLKPKIGGTNAGMNNIKERLLFAYGDEITFNFGQEDQLFYTKITIPIGFLHSSPKD